MCFFFFKQKVAYEILISDCSSDVCSSDLFATSVKLIQNLFLEFYALHCIENDIYHSFFSKTHFYFLISLTLSIIASRVSPFYLHIGIDQMNTSDRKSVV